MTILTGSTIVADSSTPEAFVVGATPTTQSGFLKESDQVGLFVYSSSAYKIYFKNSSDEWVRHADIQSIPVNNRGMTYPWGDYTAVCFAASAANAKIHIHVKRGTILYDTTPEDPNDNANSLLTPAGSTAVNETAYDLPTADGTDGQVLTTDGSSNITWKKPELNTGFLVKASIYGGNQTISTTTRGTNNTHPDGGIYQKVQMVVSGGLDTTAYSDADYDYTIPQEGWYEFTATIQWCFNTMDEQTWFDAIITSDTQNGRNREFEYDNNAIVFSLETFPLGHYRFRQYPTDNDENTLILGDAKWNQRTTQFSTVSYCTAGEKVCVMVRQGHFPDHGQPGTLSNQLLGFDSAKSFYPGGPTNWVIKRIG